MHKKHTIAPFRLGVVLTSIRRISQSTILRQEAADVRKMISRQANYSNSHALFLHLHYDMWLKRTFNKSLNIKLHFSTREANMLLGN